MSTNLGVTSVVVGEMSPALDVLEDKLTKTFEDLTFKDKALDLFFKEKLLARAIEDDVSLEYSSLGSAGKEVEYLNSKEGLQHASSTLLVPEKPVHVYKTQGLLFSGETSELEHISSVDSNSAVSNEGELIASHDPDTTMGTLEELSEVIKTTDVLIRSRLNEVNGHFFMKDLVGLFRVSYRDIRIRLKKDIEMKFLQQALEKKYGILLPVYEYDQEAGQLKKIEFGSARFGRAFREISMNQDKRRDKSLKKAVPLFSA